MLGAPTQFFLMMSLCYFVYTIYISCAEDYEHFFNKSYWQHHYTLSHLENDRDVSAYSGGRRLSSHAQLVCLLTRSRRNTGIDA